MLGEKERSKSERIVIVTKERLLIGLNRVEMLKDVPNENTGNVCLKE